MKPWKPRQESPGQPQSQPPRARDGRRTMAWRWSPLITPRPATAIAVAVDADVSGPGVASGPAIDEALVCPRCLVVVEARIVPLAVPVAGASNPRPPRCSAPGREAASRPA